MQLRVRTSKHDAQTEHYHNSEKPFECEELKGNHKHVHIVDGEQLDFQNDKPRRDGVRAVWQESKSPLQK